MDKRLDFFESNWAFFAGFGNSLFDFYRLYLSFSGSEVHCLCLSPYKPVYHVNSKSFSKILKLIFKLYNLFLESINHAYAEVILKLYTSDAQFLRSRVDKSS